MPLLILWLASADAIVTRNIFCSGCRQQPAEPPVQLSAELVSTLVCPRDPEWSRALLREPSSGEMRLVARGERFGGARLTSIYARFVIVSAADGTSRRLMLTAAPPASTGSR